MLLNRKKELFRLCNMLNFDMMISIAGFIKLNFGMIVPVAGFIKLTPS